MSSPPGAGLGLSEPQWTEGHERMDQAKRRGLYDGEMLVKKREMQNETTGGLEEGSIYRKK